MATFAHHAASEPMKQRCKHVYARPPQAPEITFNLSVNCTSSMEAPLVAASERFWAAPYKGGGGPVFVRAHGATEVFPPEDADCIVDNTATGSTLRANSLDIVDELMRSSTRMQ